MPRFFRKPSPLLQPANAGDRYPERSQESCGVLAGMVHAQLGLVQAMDLGRCRFGPVLAAIHRHGRKLAPLAEAGLAAEVQELRCLLRRHGLTRELAIRTFALVREAAGRTLGMRHYDTQLQGGWIMMHGRLAEMATGEGKTLAATLPAAAAALAGVPVHVVTANDYLAARDARLMGPLYRALGLSAGPVTAAMDASSRRHGYGCDIAYCTGKQLAFDYLRDRLVLDGAGGVSRLRLKSLYGDNTGPDSLFLRGLHFALVDEADSVLIDEARTPFILSRRSEGDEEESVCRQALELAIALREGADFTVDYRQHRIFLSETGSSRLAEAAGRLGTVWQGPRRREELVRQALIACHLYRRDRHYLVKGGKVLIIDDNTGRTMPDRHWQRGLHQLIEIKENCPVTGRRETMARLTYQRFFRRYRHLAGMTGTAREVCRELWSVYSLAVSRVPPHRPCRRIRLASRIYADKEASYAAVLDRIRETHRTGRPVLVCTRSVAESERLGTELRRAGLPHRVLNARQDSEEAEIIACAGRKSAITIATNMAGRGTDIPLSPDVAELGGLHIIVTERNEARRIDRQLHGRCGRQGDPGSYEAIVSLDDELLRHRLGKSLRHLLGRMLARDRFLAQGLGLLAMRVVQMGREQDDRRRRRDLLQAEEQLDRLLAFSGRME